MKQRNKIVLRERTIVPIPPPIFTINFGKGDINVEHFSLDMLTVKESHDQDVPVGTFLPVLWDKGRGSAVMPGLEAVIGHEQAPEGFERIITGHSSTGNTPWMVSPYEVKHEDLIFRTESLPTLPLQFPVLTHEDGYEAVFDAKGVLWVLLPHGRVFIRATPDEIAGFPDELAEALGFARKPSWQQEAEKNGWTPPGS